MGAIGKGAKFFDKGFVPLTLDELDETVLALRCERISAVFLVALLALGAYRITPQLTNEIVGLEFSPLSGVLRDSDSCLLAIPTRGCLDLVLDLGRAPAAADDVDDLKKLCPRIETHE